MDKDIKKAREMCKKSNWRGEVEIKKCKKGGVNLRVINGEGLSCRRMKLKCAEIR